MLSIHAYVQGDEGSFAPNFLPTWANENPSKRSFWRHCWRGLSGRCSLGETHKTAPFAYFSPQKECLFLCLVHVGPVTFWSRISLYCRVFLVKVSQWLCAGRHRNPQRRTKRALIPRMCFFVLFPAPWVDEWWMGFSTKNPWIYLEPHAWASQASQAVRLLAMDVLFNQSRPGLRCSGFAWGCHDGFLGVRTSYGSTGNVGADGADEDGRVGSTATELFCQKNKSSVGTASLGIPCQTQL